MKYLNRGVKSLFTVLLTVLLLTACDRSSTDSTVTSQFGMAPSFHLSTPDGELISLPRQSESLDIYLFWATWCPYCGQLMPHLQSIKDEYGDRVTIYAINIKENGDPVEYMNQRGYDFTLLLEGDDVAELYDVDSTPGLMLVDGNGYHRFDMSTLLAPSSKALEGLSHRQRSRRIAPWWAGQIRQQIDQIIAEN